MVDEIIKEIPIVQTLELIMEKCYEIERRIERLLIENGYFKDNKKDVTL